MISKGEALTDSIQAVRSQMVAAQQDAQAQYDSIAGPQGDIAQAATQLAGLNKSIASYLTNGDSPNDLMDARDKLLDQLSGYGQISVQQLPVGLDERLVRRRLDRHDVPDRGRPDRLLERPDGRLEPERSSSAA